MSTDKPCPFCSANSDQNTAVHAVCVHVDDDPLATARRLFDALSPSLMGLAAVYDGTAKAAFWDATLGHVTALVVASVGPAFADSLMTHAAVMVKAHAASQPTGRPN